MIEGLTPLSAQTQLIHFINGLHNFTGKEVSDKKQPPKKKKKKKKAKGGSSPARGEGRTRVRLVPERPESWETLNMWFGSPQEIPDEGFDPFLCCEKKQQHRSLTGCSLGMRNSL